MKIKQKHNVPKSMGYRKCSSKKDVYSDIGLAQETNKKN